MERDAMGLARIGGIGTLHSRYKRRASFRFDWPVKQEDAVAIPDERAGCVLPTFVRMRRDSGAPAR